MTDYFGFKPSDTLTQMIEEAEHIISNKVDTDYYPYRNALAQRIAREMMDNLLVNLISVIPNPERQATMQKIVSSIESATETLLKILMGKDDNQAVLKSYYFLKNDSMFIDNEGQRRIGLALSANTAQKIRQGFDAVSEDTTDLATFKAGLEAMNDAILDHFMNQFTNTLPLGMIKRKSIPIARTAVDSGLGIAMNKLLPQLPQPALKRLANFYSPFIVQIE
ncbi:hypothetical protein [Psychrobacter sp. I-STPA6b]|uniref:hypothetical protein n=1 Tax=Psychrobacter sp. I-STPA6b TaxID=2585718 RepID=UPI001D0C676F|nr:hypothetical protein [Psychrobacter sp. I-STPA6b]